LRSKSEPIQRELEGRECYLKHGRKAIYWEMLIISLNNKMLWIKSILKHLKHVKHQ